MAELVYILCGITSFICAALLTRAYLATRGRLLFWSAIAFSLLLLNNVLLVLDLLVVPQHDLRVIRAWLGVVAMVVLIYGFAKTSIPGGRT